MPANPAKSAQTCNAILDAAITLFIRDGFEKSSMDAIAVAARVAKGTLYYHYDSKEGIVDAILERYSQTMIERLKAVENNARLDAVGKFAAFGATLKAVNAATFSRLHRVKYIDIHEKTGRVIVERFAPYLARILEEGSRTAKWRVAYPLEYAEIFLAAGAALFDPELGIDRLPKRVQAMAQLCALATGADEKTLERTLKPILVAGAARKTRSSGGKGA